MGLFSTSRSAAGPAAAGDTHAVLGTPLRFEAGIPDGMDVVWFGMGCFWGAEKKMWQIAGVHSTAVGYQGGSDPAGSSRDGPSYEQVCTGATGHAEMVQVVYDPRRVTLLELLRVFWENHDPTQGDRQGNDVGSQYRSAIYTRTPEQAEVVQRTKDVFERVLVTEGLGPPTTDIRSAAPPFHYAEDHHQQYLHKVPHGYDCHSSTGLKLPL